jgi:hypothetical protein
MSPIKKKDPICPTKDCSIRSENFDNALCDLGASVSVMPKKVFDKISYTTPTLTSMCLQLADQLVRHPTGIAENILVKIQNFFIPVDFIVLDMQEDMKTPLVLFCDERRIILYDSWVHQHVTSTLNYKIVPML